MAYDSARGVTVLFGGANSGDTWEWNGAMWKAAATAGPPARNSASLAYDSARGRVVLFGGYLVTHDIHGTHSVYYGDTWEWDGSSWTQVASTGPSGRYGASMVYDSARGKTVLFGGNTGTSGSDQGDTWEWDGSAWTRVALAGPAPRNSASMAYDGARGKTVLFGGRTTDSTGNPYLFGDTWEWDGTLWKYFTSAGPAARQSAAMAYDGATGKTVLFGGVSYGSQSATRYGDTWEWDGSAWTLLTSAGPSARASALMDYDSARSRLVMFGGSTTAGLSDVWEFDGSAWTQASGTGPMNRDAAAMAYDSKRGVMVLFGGYNENSLYLGDTWEWDGSAWKQVSTIGPAPRRFASMAYDSARGKVLLFGGEDQSQTYGDTWEWDGTTWTEVNTAPNAAAPLYRFGASMAYDSQRAKVVLFGGLYNSLRDTWEWDGSAWKQVATTGPSARGYAPMAYDSNRHVMVLFGGWGSSICGDTWEWNGSAWKQVATTGPAPRYWASLAYDSQRGKTILFGGGDGTNPLGDTWEWDGSAWTQVGATGANGPAARAAAAMAYDNARDRTFLFGGYNYDITFADAWTLDPPCTMQDAAHVLQWADGLAPLPDGALDRYDLDTDGTSAGKVDLADAVRILRKAAGIDPNP